MESKIGQWSQESVMSDSGKHGGHRKGASRSRGES